MKSSAKCFVKIASLLAFIFGPGSAIAMGFLAVHPDPQPLPAALVDISSETGQLRLQHSLHADYEFLLPHFSAQEFQATCGIATAATVLDTMSPSELLTQDRILNSEMTGIKPAWQILIDGMQLSELGALFQKEGHKADVRYAGSESLDGFRTSVVAAMSDDLKFLVVNFSRPALGEEGVAHISPVGAYDAESDSILVMDVAAYKYPMTWVTVTDMFRAMNTKSTDSNQTRGWLSIE